MKHLLLACTILFACASAHAASPVFADPCKDEEAMMTQPGMNACANYHASISMIHLNQAYLAVLKTVRGDKTAEAKLSKTQRAWLAFRDAQCDFETFGSEEGSIYPLELANCRTGLNEKRAQDLRKMVRQ